MVAAHEKHSLRSHDFDLPLFTVMVSSRIVGMGNERKALKRRIEELHGNFRVWLSEGAGSSGRSALELCLNAARKCDCLILLLGRTYGTPPSGHEESITQQEWEAARAHNPNKVFAYKKHGKTKDGKQIRFINAVRDNLEGISCPEYRGIADLCRRVLSDVIGYHGTPQRLQARRPRLPVKSKSTPHSSDLAKQRAHLSSRSKATQRRLAEHVLTSLNANERRALALIDTAGLLSTRAGLEHCFAGIQWSRLIRRLAKIGAIRERDEWLHVVPNVEAALSRDATAQRGAREEWIENLGEDRQAVEVQLSRSIHLLALDRHELAFGEIHDLLLGTDNLVIARLAEAMLEGAMELKPRLSARARFLLEDSKGLVSIRREDSAAARKRFNNALRIARSLDDKWPQRLAYLHRGSAWALAKAHVRAIRDYNTALELAVEAGDQLLIGHAQNNIGNSLLEYDLVEAERVLRESLTTKHASGDTRGLFAAYTGLGIAAGKGSDHSAALKYFRRATRLARGWNDHASLAIALTNESATLHHLGRMQDAVELSANALEHARECGQPDAIRRTLQGNAVQLAHLAEYQAAKPRFLELAQLKTDMADTTGVCDAITDAAICAWRSGEREEARRLFKRALTAAEGADDTEAATRTIEVRVGLLGEAGQRVTAERVLDALLTKYRRAGRTEMVLAVANTLAGVRAQLGRPPDRVDAVWKIAEEAAENGPEIFKLVELLRQRYAFNRDVGRIEAANDALKTMLRVCSRHKTLKRDYVQALDERATQYQRAGKYRDAERLYERVLKVVDNHLDGSVPSSVANNFAELYRKTERLDESIEWYKKSISAAQAEEDIEGTLLALGNLGLALTESRKLDEATKTLQKMKRIAKRASLWPHFADALRKLGDVAWMSGRTALAIRRYDDAAAVYEENELQQGLAMVILNRARLLAERGRDSEVADLLRARRKTWQNTEYAAECLVEYGRALIQLQKYADSSRILTDAVERARAQGDQDGARALSSVLETATRRKRLRSASISSLRAREGPSQDRWQRLLDLLEARILKRSSDKLIRSSLNSLVESIEESHASQQARAYGEVADALWDHLPDVSAEIALCGMWKAMGRGQWARSREIGSSLADHLHSLALRKGKRSFDALRRGLEKRGASQLGLDSDQARLIAFWPVVAVESLIGRPYGGRGMTESEWIEHVNQLTAEESPSSQG